LDRPLQVPKDWTNPTGKYNIGVIAVYDLFPKSLRERMAKEYTENEWQPMHKTVTAEAVRQLQEFQNKYPDSSSDTPSQKLIREDLQSKVDFLKQMEKKFNDLGPTYDCVVFNDGKLWK
jgi:tripeptidyl-peptidase-2